MLNNNSTPKIIGRREFANMGAKDTVYIRPLDHQGQTVYGLYSVDGKRVAVAADYDQAIMTARYNNLQTERVH